MATLDLYKKRPPHTVILNIDNKKTPFNIPTHYTIEETERILEIQRDIDELKLEKVEENSAEQQVYLEMFWEKIYAQALVLFQHYHPEVTAEYLKKYLSQEDAAEIIAFHTEQHLKNTSKDELRRVKKKVMRSS